MEQWFNEFLQGWQPTIYHFLFGALGGLVASLVQTNGVIMLPCLVKRNDKCGVYLGSFAPCFIGGFVGFIVDHSPLFAGLGGYVGTKVLDILIARFFPTMKKGDTSSG